MGFSPWPFFYWQLAMLQIRLPSILPMGGRAGEFFKFIWETKGVVVLGKMTAAADVFAWLLGHRSFVGGGDMRFAGAMAGFATDLSQVGRQG